MRAYRKAPQFIYRYTERTHKTLYIVHKEHKWNVEFGEKHKKNRKNKIDGEAENRKMNQCRMRIEIKLIIPILLLQTRAGTNASDA